MLSGKLAIDYTMVILAEKQTDKNGDALNISRPDILAMMNEEYPRIARELHNGYLGNLQEVTLTLANGEYEVDLPADFGGKVCHVDVAGSNDEYQPLMSPAGFVQLVTHDPQSRSKYRYIVMGRRIRFNHPGQKEVRVWYHKTPDALTDAETSFVYLPAEHEKYLCWYAAETMAVTLGRDPIGFARRRLELRERMLTDCINAQLTGIKAYGVIPFRDQRNHYRDNFERSSYG